MTPFLELLARKSPPAGELFLSAVFTLSVFCVLVMAVGLALEPRYKNFDVYGLLVIALGLFYLWTQATERASAELAERAISLFLAGAALFVLVNETPVNVEADLWVIACLVLAYLLWRNSEAPDLIPLYRLLLVGIAAYVLFYFIRVNILTTEQFVDLCAKSPQETICLLRANMGKALYFSLYGITAVLLAILGFFSNRLLLSYAGFVASIGAILLFNTGLGALAFAFTLITILSVTGRGRDPRTT